MPLTIAKCLLFITLAFLLNGCSILEDIAEWNLDLSIPYNHIKNWAGYHLEHNGVWGYLLIFLMIVISGYSNELTRPTVSLVVSGAIKAVSALVFIGIGATLLKILFFFGKVLVTQIQRVWKGLF
jgi:hypothetical protein